MRGSDVVAVASGPVLSPIPQTSQAAEWCALAAAAEVMCGPTVVHADSQGVVGACEGSGAGPMPWGYWKKRHGAIARQAWHANAGTYHVEKCRAHTQRPDDLDPHLDFDLDVARRQNDENPAYYVQYAHARICSVLSAWGALRQQWTGMIRRTVNNG